MPIKQIIYTATNKKMRFKSDIRSKEEGTVLLERPQGMAAHI